MIVLTTENNELLVNSTQIYRPTGPQGIQGPALSSSYLYLGRDTSDTYNNSNQYVNFGGTINTSLDITTADNINIQTPSQSGIYFITCSLNGTAIGNPNFDFVISNTTTRVLNTPSFSVPSSNYTGTITTSFIVNLTNAQFSVRLSNGGSNTFTTYNSPSSGLNTSAFLSIFRIG